jgi:hypothetical protein
MPIFNIRAAFVLLCLGGGVTLAERYMVLMGVPLTIQSVLVGVISGCVVFLGTYRGASLLRFILRRSIVRESGDGQPRETMAMAGISVCVVRSDTVWAVTANDGGRACAFISDQVMAGDQHELLAGVLAHESAHVQLGHVRRLCDILGFLALAKFSVGVPWPAVIVVLLAYLAMMRSWEFEADEWAARSIGAGAMEQALSAFAVRVTAVRMSRVAEWFSAHPCLFKRIERMRGL